MPQGKSVVDASSGGRLNSRTARPGFAGTVPGWTPNATAWKTRSEDGWRNDAGWEAADRLGFGRRLLFVLVTGTCVFASIMLFAVMAGQWRALLASLPEWVRGRSEQVGSVGRWVSAMLMEFGRASQSWWYRPLLLMSGILVLALAAAMGVLVYSAGRTAMDAWREHRAWNTLPVHMVFWTFLASGTLVVSVEVGRMVGGRVHWLTLWIVLAVSAFIAYHRILSRRGDDFIRDNG